MLRPGTYAAVAALAQDEHGREVAVRFGESDKKKTPFAAVVCKVIRGPFAGQTITWTGYFTGGATEHSVKAIRNFGFTGEDLAEMPDQRPDNEVEIVVGQETNDEGRTFAKVLWVNSPGRGMKISAPIEGGDLRKFASRFKATLKGAPAVKGTKAVLEAPSDEAPSTTSDEHSQAGPPDDGDPGPQEDPFQDF